MEWRREGWDIELRAVGSRRERVGFEVVEREIGKGKSWDIDLLVVWQAKDGVVVS